MTTLTPVIPQAELQTTESWQQALADVIRQPEELFTLLQLDKTPLPAALVASQDFPLRVPRCFVARMKPGCVNDPLLKQVLPLGTELEYQPGFTDDPLDERDSNPIPGLIHKYHGRVLLIVSGGCAINCRYCFRRHFPYSDNNPSRAERQQMLDYLRTDSTITEIILSGGDPLAASDQLLAELVNDIAAIPHITTLRVHSRMPIVIPQRINESCLQWLTGTRLNVVMVVHCNHANEINQSVRNTLTRLKLAGITVLNQAVLLAGVNDEAKSLNALSESLFAAGALPYYLHVLDRVKGAAHFQVSEHRGQQLINELLAHLPGYLVPKLVKEVAGASSKIPIPPAPATPE